ncbi:unnamed protein product [Adineta steineri]|uniref:Fibronectin type-III domain-containing protein n=1 Tax=Adineta steineri TaxID=433720 RepID=A0A819G8T7_9BILA|nr:unnamed protein product [Adineta steineri]
MEETPHLVAHFMAVGAEKRLEDYHFLRNTYETITGQEIQLNRILRMLGEDEINLNWRADLLPIGRARRRTLYEFNQLNNTLVLKGSIAYERLRDLEHETFQRTREPSMPTSSRRVQELRERRQRYSEQRECPSSSLNGTAASSSSSSSRLRALNEYDTALADSEKKRQQQAEENRLNALKNKEKESTENKREKFKSMFDDENSNYGKSKQQNEDRINNRSTRTDLSNEDKINNRSTRTDLSNEDKDQQSNSDRIRKSSNKSDYDKTGDIELISFTVRCETVPSLNNAQNEEDASIRLFCKWASPSSSSAINYYTIERQIGDKEEWLPVGEKIDKLDNQTQLDISLLKDAGNSINKNLPSYFRLKAHLQNGQTFMSKPTDGINLNLSKEKSLIIPDVEILSPNSVQLTWSDDTNDKKIGKDDDDNKNKNDNNIKQKEKSNLYDIQKKEEQESEWEKVLEVPLSQHSARLDSLTDAKQCQFRLIPTSSEPEEITKTGTTDTISFKEKEVEPEILTVHNVNELLSSLHIVPTSSTTVDIDISEEGFKEYDSYKIEYTTSNQLNQWKQMSDITHDNPHLTIDNLKQGTDYKFRFTPMVSGTTAAKNETNSSQLSLILDVKTPSSRRGRFTQNESETPTTTSPPVSTKELFAEHEIESSAASPSNFSNKDVFTENETEGSTAVSPQLSTKEESVGNEDENSNANSSHFPSREDVDQNEDENEDENEASVPNSPESSSQKNINENKSETSTATTPHQFRIQKLDSTSVLIEAIVPEEEPATFEDVFEVFSKKETTDNDDEESDWTKVGTIDKEHLSTTVDNLEEDTSYEFKVDNITSPLADDESNTMQVFKIDTKSVKKYDPSSLLEKIEESLENVVNGVMRAAAGHQIVEESINHSLNEVIREVFRDDALLPNEEYGFDTLALNTDLQLYRGPKQMMLKDLEVDETIDLSKHYGEIIIHNYGNSQQSVIVREENGNTRVGNIDGDIIIRNVVSDVLLKNEKTNNQLSMNIVGQAFLKGVQGSLIASKFRGIIVVKNVNKR